MTRTALLMSAMLTLAPACAAHKFQVPVAQSAQPQIAIEATDLGSGIFMLKGQGGNIGVLTGEDGTFVIDSQFPDLSAANLAKIEEISGGGPTYLVNTHWHGDHVGGNEAFNVSGAVIVAHENVRKRLADYRENPDEGGMPAVAVNGWPVITFPESMTFHLNGQTVDLVHYPHAHTDGDAVIFFREANIIHIGDILFSGLFPYVDLESGGSLNGYLDAMDAIYALADDETVIIAGHGPISSRQDIADSAQVLRDTSAAVAALVTEGKTLEEVLEAAPLTPWVDEWAWAFMTEERYTTVMYNMAKEGMSGE